MGKKNKSKKKKKVLLPKGLPEKFIERTEAIFGAEAMEKIRKTFIDKPTTFRVNTIKSTKKEIDDVLLHAGLKTSSVEWIDEAYILKTRLKKELTDLSIYSDGKIYIQSLASMVPPVVLDPQPGEKVLDLTAAPGSKTSQMAAMMERKGELVANDSNKIRFFRLKHNMEHLGVVNFIDNPNNQNERGELIAEEPESEKDWKFTLRQEDGSALSQEYGEYFDKILVDAPCSGESRFIEGYPKSYGYWSEHKIKQVAYRQHKLLMAAWQVLKPGGVLVYSTCTIAPEENEARISKLIEREGENHVKVIPVELKGLKRFKPVLEWKGKEFHKSVKDTIRIEPTMDTEGFFIAKLQKV